MKATFLLLTTCLVAKVSAVPGAWEAFSTQGHANAWALYDFADESIYALDWDGEADNPFVFTQTIDDNAVWLFADTVGGQAELLGDYREVRRIRLEVYIDEPTNLDFLDLALRLPVGGTPGYVYSELRLGSEFSEAGWYDLEFDLDTDWFILNGANEFEAIRLGASELEDVSEVGVRFFPVTGLTASQFYALDNLRLEARLQPGEFTPSEQAGEFQLAIVPGAGREADLQQWSVSDGWQDVTNWTGLEGVVAQNYSEPIAAQGLFRLQLRPVFTEVTAP